MSDFSIKISSAPSTISELSAFIDENCSDISVSLNQSASHRNFSIVEVILTVVTTQTIGLFFSLLKDFITAKLNKESPQKGFAIEINGALIEITTEADLGKLEDLEKIKISGPGHAE